MQISRIYPTNSTIHSENVEIAIYGSGFTNTMLVYYEDEPMTHVTITPTIITIVVHELTSCGIKQILLKDQEQQLTTVFIVAPKITSLQDSEGPVCDRPNFAIHGDGFTNTTTISIDDVSIPATFVSNQKVTVTLPLASYTGIVYIKAQTNGVFSNALKYTYQAPHINTLSQTSGSITENTTITVSGSFFGLTTTIPTILRVMIQGYTIPPSNVFYNDSNSLAVTLPSITDADVRIGESNICVVMDTIRSNTYPFIYLPSLLTISQSNGYLGDEDEIIITGAGFYENCIVKFGTLQCNSIDFVDKYTLKVITPCSDKVGDVFVTLRIGKYEAPQKIKFTYLMPYIDSIVPSYGTNQQTSARITGNGLRGKIVCAFGDVTQAICNESKTDLEVPLRSQMDERIGTVNVFVTKQRKTTNVLTYTYVTSITHITPELLETQKSHLLQIHVTGYCKIDTTNFTLRCFDSDIPAMDVTYVPATPCTAIESILHFMLPSNSLSGPQPITLYIDDIASSHSFIYYYTPPTVLPTIIVVDEPVIFTLTGTNFTSDTRVKMNDVDYAPTSYTDSIFVFSAPAFTQSGFTSLYLYYSSTMMSELRIFVYPRIDTILYSSQTSSDYSEFDVKGSGWNPSLNYVITIDDILCTYVYESAAVLHVMVQLSHENVLNKQLEIKVLDNITYVLYSQSFSYFNSITHIEPTYSMGGTTAQTITIYGNDFDETTQLQIDDALLPQNAIIERSATHILFTMPPNALAHISKIYAVQHITHSENYFSYTHMPYITLLSPTIGSADHSSHTIIIHGYRFQTDSNKAISLFVNDSLTPYTPLNNNTISMTLPPSTPSGHVAIYMTFHNEKSNIVTYTNYPFLDSLSQTSGYISGNQSIILYGGRFNATTSILFGDVLIDYSQFISITSSSITFYVPPMQTNVRIDIFVKVGELQSLSSLHYEYLYPLMKSLSHTQGIIHGYEDISIYGEGFSANIDVLFGKNILTSSDYIYKDENIISFLTPPSHDTSSIQVRLRVLNTILDQTLSYQYISHRIDSIYPDHGYSSGGNDITITGTGFTNDADILYENQIIPKSQIISITPCAAKFKLPAVSRIGPVYFNIRIDKQISDHIAKFIYVCPYISSICPQYGKITGGESIIIYGDGFSSDNMTLQLGDCVVAKSNIQTLTPTTIVFLSPPISQPGKYTVRLSINNVQATSSSIFFYIPNISKIMPISATVGTSPTVTIYGEGFTTTSIIKIGNQIISPLTNACNSITFVLPIFSHAQILPIVVQTNHVSSNQVYFSIQPIMKSITPNPWMARDLGNLYIYGEGFAPSSIVSISSNHVTQLLPITTITPTIIECPLPLIHTSGEVVIGINSDLNTWVYFKTIVYPHITQLSANAGPITGNNKIILTGTGFISNMEVKIDKNTLYNTEYIDTTSIAIIMPPSKHLQTVTISLHTPEYHSNSVLYTYSPSILAIIPNWSPLHEEKQVTILGEGFDKNYSVLFNDMILPNRYNSDKKEIIVTIPAGYEVYKNRIQVSITQQNNTYMSHDSVDFFYSPCITTVSLESSSVTAQQELHVYGSGFSTVSSVLFDTIRIASENITLVDSNHLFFRLPIVPTQGLYSIKVVTHKIHSAIPFLFPMAAEIIMISHEMVPCAGGITMTVTGAGFTNELLVYYNDVSISYKLDSEKTISFLLPRGELGINNLQIVCEKYQTFYTKQLTGYPCIEYMTQKYNATLKKTTISLYGCGFISSTRITIGLNHNITPSLYSPGQPLQYDIIDYDDYDINPPLSVYVVSQNLTSPTDTIFFSNNPLITSIHRQQGSVSGNEEIIIQGSGFDNNTTLWLVEKSQTIIPHLVHSNTLLFYSPRVSQASIVQFIIKSDCKSSAPFSYTYCPHIHSISPSYCQVGEHVQLNIYGHGFEKYYTEIYVEPIHITCSFIDFHNDTVIRTELPRLDVPGILHLSAIVRTIASENSLVFEIKPVILSLDKEFINVNGDNIQLKGKGLLSASSVIISYKTQEYSFTIFTEQIIDNTCLTFCYSRIPELKSYFEKHIHINLPVDIYICANGARSLPYHCIMKNIHFDDEMDHEIRNISHLCNYYLRDHYFTVYYHLLLPYSEPLSTAIKNFTTTVFQLPGMYLHPKSKSLFCEIFTNACTSSIVPIIIIHNFINHLMKIVFCSMLNSKTIISNIVLFPHPFTIDTSCITQLSKVTDCDYYFQTVATAQQPIFSSEDLQNCICCKMVDSDIVIEINHPQLMKLCTQWAIQLLQTQFLLSNRRGRFVGTDVCSPTGTISELYLYKITSSLLHYPYQTSSILDLQKMQRLVADGNTNIDQQLYDAFSNIPYLQSLYIQQIRKNTRTDLFTKQFPFPFFEGDRFCIPVSIGGRLEFIDEQLHQNIKDLFTNSCDPLNSSAIDYLLDHNGSTIRPTLDIYEITLM